MKYGAVSANGQYSYPSTTNQFTDAADALYTTIGSRLIKIYASPDYEAKYPLQASWTGTVPTNLTELVQLTEYSDVITMGWTDIVFTTFSFANGITNWWMVDISRAKLDAEYTEIYNFVVHLLTTYNDSGITFTLQGLEQDWNLNLPTYTADAVADRNWIDNFVAWFGTRQRAVHDAVRDTAHTNVKVLHALEPNRIIDAFQYPHRNRLITHIAPRLETDVIHLSSYEMTIDYAGWTADQATWIATYTPLFTQSIRRIKQAWPNCKIRVSEIGWPEGSEMPAGFNIATMIETIRAIAEAEGVEYFIYWLVFDNELGHSGTYPNSRGYWFISQNYADGYVGYSGSSGAQTVTINGTTVSFSAGATDDDTVQNAITAIQANGTLNALVYAKTYSPSNPNVLYIVAKTVGTVGNAYGLSATGTGSAASGSSLSNGIDPGTVSGAGAKFQALGPGT